MRDNAFAVSLNGGAGQIGIWCNLSDPIAVEIAASAGFDWLLLDTEHAPADPITVVHGLQAAAAHPVSVLVRPPNGDVAIIKRLLDVGAQNLLIPMVESVQQAREIAAAVAFPPHGIRGVSSQTRAGNWGRDAGYLSNARDGICVIVQIESVAGVAAIADIAAVDGVDALFVGTADLAASMGLLGQPKHPDVLAAVDTVVAAAAAAGKPIGGLTRHVEDAQALLDRGFAFVGVGTDTAIFATALDSLRARFPAA
ncbi:HpcH/HpaI aldolase family protein [Microterricola pindariensis]|uniref:HpcH/HpaI aldolase/citrate lyase domain-containing protein n=1 Tax=Microterricola pindariensis TaxID=478010 RepID=A0ABX5AU47_9MICO|nr:aldolase/citrate lyase family protein [Microterricola pindariensis]PPL17200.1 hypothetical protein GY24_11755 [Microterricola pindariensis]